MRGYLDTRLTSLRTKVVLVAVCAFSAAAVPAYIAFESFTRHTVEALGTMFAEKQVMFDRYRGQEALTREVALAETVASAPAIRDWVQDESDPGKAARGLAELEHYRLSFHDRSYFFIVNATGDYYFNDAANDYAGRQLRYRLNRDNPRDAWYFKTIASGDGCHLNVDRDDALAVTKVWINCVLRDSSSGILGMIGTGVDLSEFIREVVAVPQTGVISMFVDRSGAIQAHRDQDMVDFHSLTKDTSAKKTVFQQIDNAADADALAAMMERLVTGTKTVESRFMKIGGRDYLVGVGYLAQLGWFNVTLMDIDTIIDRRLFTPTALLLIAMMAAAVALVTALFRRVVLDRLAKVETSARRVAAGDFEDILVDSSGDEIGRLSRTLAGMARTVHANTRVLEEMVSERTQKLRRLANLDLLTGIPNRRGFSQVIGQRLSDGAHQDRPAGLLLVDLDGFKKVNDAYGHQAGDRLLCETVRRLCSVLGETDICGRWGGDEFVVLLTACDEASLRAAGARMLQAVAAAPICCDNCCSIDLTVSIGASLIEAGESIDIAFAQADAALYAAKRGGRNRFECFGDNGATGVAEALELSA